VKRPRSGRVRRSRAGRVKRPRATAMPTEHRPRAPVLPDVLGPGLAVVFCGSAVGLKSAQVGAYYAGPGNRFWPTLAAVGLTPRRLAPEEYATVLDYGIGLTDLTKTEFGADAALSGRADDPSALARKIENHRPCALAFNGKRAAAVFVLRQFGRLISTYGCQPERIGTTAIFVLPSTSGAAARYWTVRPWIELAEFLCARR